MKLTLRRWNTYLLCSCHYSFVMDTIGAVLTMRDKIFQEMSRKGFILVEYGVEKTGTKHRLDQNVGRPTHNLLAFLNLSKGHVFPRQDLLVCTLNSIPAAAACRQTINQLVTKLQVVQSSALELTCVWFARLPCRGYNSCDTTCPSVYKQVAAHSTHSDWRLNTAMYVGEKKLNVLFFIAYGLFITSLTQRSEDECLF